MVGLRLLLAAAPVASAWSADVLGVAGQGRRASRVTLAAAAAPPTLAFRIGHGYDIHRMASRDEAGQPVVISGVVFDGTDAPDFELGCVAHSDGDVVYHSVVDAILGALTMPDIGQLFPDNDPRLRGADSSLPTLASCSPSSSQNDLHLTWPLIDYSIQLIGN